MTRRLGQALVLAVAVAALSVPVALGGNSPDAFERAVARHSQVAAPDAFERAVARHSQAGTSADGRSPDTIDAARTAQSRRSSVTQLDLRSPDTRDAASQAGSQVVTVVARNAFDWGDFGIGVAASFGVLLLVGLGAGTLMVRQYRGGSLESN